MESRQASTFINNNNFVPRKISKKIINFLNFENNFEEQKVLGISKYLTLKNLIILEENFKNIKMERKLIPLEIRLFTSISIISQKIQI